MMAAQQRTEFRRPRTIFISVLPSYDMPPQSNDTTVTVTFHIFSRIQPLTTKKPYPNLTIGPIKVKLGVVSEADSISSLSNPTAVSTGPIKACDSVTLRKGNTYVQSSSSQPSGTESVPVSINRDSGPRSMFETLH